MKMFEYLEKDIRNMLDTDIGWERLRDTTVLVTGASGMLGSMICRTLSEMSVLKGWNLKILGVVRDTEKASSMLGDVIKNNNISFLRQDIQEYLKPTGTIDYIIHLASPTKSQYFISRPVETLRAIVLGTANIMELARIKNAHSVVYLSSMEVYGQVTGEELLTEEKMGYINPILLRSSYPEGKRSAEALCAAYASEYEVPVKIARLAQTFGPGILTDDNRVFVQFYRSVSAGEDIVMYTDGGTKHMYIDTMDAVSAILFLLLEGEDGQAYNVANEKNYCSIREMAELVLKEFGNGRSMLKIDKSRDVGQYPAEHKWMLDVSKMKALGWEARYTMVDMYRRMSDSFGGVNPPKHSGRSFLMMGQMEGRSRIGNHRISVGWHLVQPERSLAA